jgi:chemotaxis protein MotA
LSEVDHLELELMLLEGSEVGRGIAVAFVAPIHGVGAANIFFLPALGKLKQRIWRQQNIREITLEGVVSSRA